MNRLKLALGVATAVSAVSLAGERQASACGGCFHPPTQTVTDITDERMLLSVSPTQSTLYDQIRVRGPAVDFAWVLPDPRHGDGGPERRRALRFDRRADGDADQPPASELPGAQLHAERRRCRDRRFEQRRLAAVAGAAAVMVLAQENVGPYATVQLHSTDSSALDTWLDAERLQHPGRRCSRSSTSTSRRASTFSR